MELWDVHTHVGIDQGFNLRRWWPYASTSQDLLLQMTANGISRGVCFPFTLPSAFDPYKFADEGKVELLPGRFPFDRENENLIEELGLVDVEKRLLPLAMFDPSREISKQVKSLEKLVRRIAGLKTQSTTLQSPIRGLLNEGRELMELAQQNNLPVLFHTATFKDDQWAQVRDCLDVAAAYPKVRFNLAHNLRFGKKYLEEAAKTQNVWVDCSAHLIHCKLGAKKSPIVMTKADAVDTDYTNPRQVMLDIYAIMGAKYLWGSDSPYQSWCATQVRTIFTYKEEADVLHSLPGDVRKSMAHDAPQAWLFGKS